MSDGDNATPGQHRALPEPDGASKWLTRTPRPAPGAAPWERRQFAPHDEPGPTAGGNHTDGVTVADLIAKVTGEIPGRTAARTRRRTEIRQHRRTTMAATTSTRRRSAVTVGLRRSTIADLDASATTRGPPRTPRSRRPSTRQPPSRPPHRIGAAARSRASEPQPSASTARCCWPAARSAALFAVLALVLTGGAWQWSATKNNRLNNVAALDPNSRDIVDPNAQFGDENFLIVGVDSRLGAERRHGRGQHRGRRRRPLGHRDAGQHPGQPQTRGRRVLPARPGDHPDEVRGLGPARPASTARSTTRRPEPTGHDQVYTETKLNSAYAFGGPKCLVKVIQKMSGLSINRFMAVDFAGFAKMVDALGGVEVCSTTPLEDYELGTVLRQRRTPDRSTGTPR